MQIVLPSVFHQFKGIDVDEKGIKTRISWCGVIEVLAKIKNPKKVFTMGEWYFALNPINRMCKKCDKLLENA